MRSIYVRAAQNTMPNLPDCAAYPRSLCGLHAQFHLVARHVLGTPAALRRVEALAARWHQPENVADGGGSAGDFRQYRDLGRARQKGAITRRWRRKRTLRKFHAEAQRARRF
jgi:hypothetical protein